MGRFYWIGGRNFNENYTGGYATLFYIKTTD